MRELNVSQKKISHLSVKLYALAISFYKKLGLGLAHNMLFSFSIKCQAKGWSPCLIQNMFSPTLAICHNKGEYL